MNSAEKDSLREPGSGKKNTAGTIEGQLKKLGVIL